MGSFRQATEITAPPEEVFRWLGRRGGQERLLPPWEPLELLRWEAPLREGSEVALRARTLLGVWQEWAGRCVELSPPGDGREGRFVEELERRSWRHSFRLIPTGDGCTLLEEEASWSEGGGDPLLAFGESSLKPRLQRMFRFRHRRLQHDLLRHSRVADRPARTVAVSGASGLIGQALVSFLRGGGHLVRPMVRQKAAPTEGPERPIYWSADEGRVDAEALVGVDAVVHLAGAPIAGRRWTEAYKETLMRSRVEGTRVLCEHLAAMDEPPEVLICGSAVGYYGDRGDEVLSEEAGPGDTFLASVCQAWEEATRPAVDAGIRVVNLRTGIVLAANGGALAPQLPAFRAGMGGAQGSGRQFIPFVALDDMVGIIHHALFDEGLRGPVNAVAPVPVRQVELAQVLGRVLNRPAFVPTPAVALRLAMGRQMADEVVLVSQRAVPIRLQERGFQWLHPDLDEALRFELGVEL